MAVPAVIRYGRYHGICYDFRLEDSFCKLKEVDLSPDLGSLPDLPDFCPSSTEPPAESKLQLSQKASKLLFSSTAQLPVPGWADLFADRQKCRLRKVEQPLVLTDHEKDMRRFLPKRNLGLQDIDFAPEILRDDDDECLSWPASIRTLCAQMNEEIGHEKLPVTKVSLQLLKGIIQENWTPESHKRLVKELLMSKKPALQPISPLLLPEDATFSPILPSSPPLKLVLTSDPASLTSLPTESPPLGPVYEDYEASFHDLCPSFKLPAYNLKAFEYEDDDLIDYHPGETSSSTIIQEIEDSDGEILETMPTNEFVSASSLISHVEVPKLSPHLPAHSHEIPPLPMVEGTAIFFQDEKTYKTSPAPMPQLQQRDASPTKIVAFSEDLETIIPSVLHGVKIPSCLKLLADDPEGNGYEPVLPKNVVKGHQMLWRPKRLSLLKGDDDDEDELVLEFNVGKCEVEDDRKLESKREMSPLLRGSPPHLDERLEELSYEHWAKKEEKILTISEPERRTAEFPKKRKPLEEIINDAKRQRGIDMGSVSRFSASGSLSSFLGTRHEVPAPEVEVPYVSGEQAEVPVPETPDPVVHCEVPSKANIPSLTPPRTIFFSTAYLQPYRSLLRFFETWAGEDLTIIYRDLEVPLLLSPKHAVMMKTLQALTQRPLPGHGFCGSSPVNDQIALLSQSGVFEFLVVLVSTPSFVGKDGETMLTFADYCAAISKGSKCQVRPWPILAGEAELHASVAKLIVEYGFHRKDSTFLEGETQEEAFLIRAGMNPFAAQIVLGQFQDDGIED